MRPNGHVASRVLAGVGGVSVARTSVGVGDESPEFGEENTQLVAKLLSGETVEEEIGGVVDVDQEENKSHGLSTTQELEREAELAEELECRVGKREHHERDRYGHEHHRDLLLTRTITR